MAVATIAVLCSGATYASQTDKELILEKLAALESRIAALETENRAIRRDAAEARAQARRATAARAEPSSFVSPSDARSSLAYKAEPAERNPSAAWSGAYWGASAGGAATRSTTTSSERYTSSFAVNPPPFDMTGVDMSSTSGPGKAAGA
jgi:outer membrane immunogenic protein